MDPERPHPDADQKNRAKISEMIGRTMREVIDSIGIPSREGRSAEGDGKCKRKLFQKTVLLRGFRVKASQGMLRAMLFLSVVTADGRLCTEAGGHI